MTLPARATERAPAEQGMALISVLLLLMTMTALSVTLAISGTTETQIARNHKVAADSRGVADAGLSHALQVTIDKLTNWEGNGFGTVEAAMSALLVGPDGASGTTATNADNGSLEGFGIPRPPGTLGLAGLQGLAYQARLFDEDDPARGLTLANADTVRINENNNPLVDQNKRIVLQVVGFATDNSVATIEATIATMTLPAIVTNGPLDISGNPTITGLNGSVHTNDDLLINGASTWIGQNATASGNSSIHPNADVMGISGGGFQHINIPPVNAIDHFAKADFVLHSDGTMTLPGGGFICNGTGGGDCESMGYGWEFNNGSNTWTIGPGPTPTFGGTFYVEGDAVISGSPGSGGAPFEISIIAEGSIDISGNPDLAPHSPELLFVTDGDLEISGGLAVPIALEGSMLVREQVKISGNPNLAGQVLVEDRTNIHSLVTSNTISGNPTFTYNGIAGTDSFTVSAWRRLP